MSLASCWYNRDSWRTKEKQKSRRFRRVIIFVDCRRLARLSVCALKVCQCHKNSKEIKKKNVILFFSIYSFSLFERITQRVTRCSRLSTVALPSAASAGQLWWSPRLHPPPSWVKRCVFISLKCNTIRVEFLFSDCWPHSWRTILTRDLRQPVLNISRPKFSNFLLTLSFILPFRWKVNGNSTRPSKITSHCESFEFQFPLD